MTEKVLPRKKFFDLYMYFFVLVKYIYYYNEQVTEYNNSRCTLNRKLMKNYSLKRRCFTLKIYTLFFFVKYIYYYICIKYNETVNVLNNSRCVSYTLNRLLPYLFYFGQFNFHHA